MERILIKYKEELEDASKNGSWVTVNDGWNQHVINVNEMIIESKIELLQDLINHFSIDNQIKSLEDVCYNLKQDVANGYYISGNNHIYDENEINKRREDLIHFQNELETLRRRQKYFS